MSTSTIRKTHADYTVGWICALTEELSAAKMMLDVTHQRLPQQEKDPNSYVLGSIGDHNIVIACSSEYGNSQAAMVASWMASSFKNLRVGLLVGIAAGIPGKVELGDIVVGVPGNGYPGVVQYDFGKKVKGGFRQTGSLNKPPPALLTALKEQRSEHEITEEGFGFQRYLENLKKSRPNLPSKFTNRPSPPEYARIPQGEEYTSPQIHYGLIASGNQVVKDAEARDAIDNDLNGHVLCIEMEAAGLVDSFPGLVIRGICDFADENKNDDWHHYAAVSAAIYAKDFLKYTRVVHINNEQPINKALQLNLKKLEQMEQDRKDAQLISKNDKILEFLEDMTPIQYALQHNSISRKRYSNTGHWLGHLPEYQNWLQQKGGILHCQGMTGVGKTVLASKIIDDLHVSNPQSGIAYAYCDYKRQAEHVAINMLVSLLIQLVRKHQESFYMQAGRERGHPYFMPEPIQKLYNTHHIARTRPLLFEIEEALRDMMKRYPRVFVIVDAVDECAIESRERFLRLLFRLHKRTGVTMNIFATSGNIQEIIDQFRAAGGKTFQLRARTEDIKNYLSYSISKSGRDILIENSELIQRKILEASDGMFLLAPLHFQSIKFKTSSKELKEGLNVLSKGTEAYSRAYEGCIYRIKAQNPDFKRLAFRVLDWLICARRPLRMRELKCAIAARALVGSTTGYISEESFPETNTIISVCAGLVCHDKESDVVRLIHSTAQKYFDNNRNLNAIHASITEICIAYLSSRLRMLRTARASDRKTSPRVTEMDSYAVEYWEEHAYRAKGSADSAVSSFLKSQEVLSLWSAKPAAVTAVSKAVGSLLIARRLRLQRCMERLVELLGSKELIEAVRRGNFAVVKLLLEYDVDLKARNSKGETALIVAAANKRLEIMRLLLAHGGAGVNERDELGETALFKATKNENVKIQKLLLANGADKRISNNKGRTVAFYESRLLRRTALSTVGLTLAYAATSVIFSTSDGEEE